MDKFEPFKGVFVPIITPFKSNYEIDEEALREHVDFVIENGVHGIIVAGSTGEFSRLFLDEKKKIFDICIDQANDRVPVLAGTHACGTDEVVHLSKYAQDAGANGLFMTTPYYGTVLEEELYEHFRIINEAADTPIMIYNNPDTTKVDMCPEFIVKLFKNLDNIRYVKECSGNSKRAHEILRLSDWKMSVFSGSDDNFYEYLVQGASGFVAGMANIIPKICVEFFDQIYNKKDFLKARDLYYRLIPLGVLLESGGRFVQYIKAGVELIGRKAGPARKPLLPLSENEKNYLKEVLTPLIDVM